MIGSPLQLIIILAIVLVLFGASKLRNIGSDLGGAIKNFRQSVKEGESDEEAPPIVQNRVDQTDSGRIIEAEVITKERADEKAKL